MLGHSSCGIISNEQKDEIERKGASTLVIAPNPFCGVERNVCKCIFNEKEDNERQPSGLATICWSITIRGRSLRRLVNNLLIRHYRLRKFLF